MTGARLVARRAGELICGGYPDPGAPPPEFLARLERGHLGGVILFMRNLPSLAAAKDIGPALAAAHLPTGVSPLAAVDEEGGFVQRLPPPWPRLPSAMSLAAGRPAPEAVRRYGRALGEALRALGILQDYAPVLDVNSEPMNPVIGTRSFGDDPRSVGSIGTALALGLQDAGVLATAKHFPGHGDTRTDSHLALPVLPLTYEALQARELAPFRVAISEGIGALMTAHIALTSLAEEPGLPATLSRRILTDVLRHDLGFQGLVVTDCLEMAAIRTTYGVAEGAVRAIAAGADQVLVSHTSARQEEAREALEAAIATGRIPESRIQEALSHIEGGRRLTVRQAPSLPLQTAMDALERIADSLAAASVSRYVPHGDGDGGREGPGRCGAGGNRGPVLLIVPGGEGPGRWQTLLRSAADAAEEAARAIPSREGESVSTLRLDREGRPLDPVTVPDAARIVVLLPSLRQHPGWLQLLASLPAGYGVVAIEDPYDAARIPEGHGPVFTSDPMPPAIRRAVTLVLEGGPAPGRLPFSRFPDPAAGLDAAGFTALEAPARPDPPRA